MTAIYIYEFAIKRPGRANLGFIIVDRDSYQDISFDVYFSKGKISKVNRTISPVYSDNNVADKLGLELYARTAKRINEKSISPSVPKGFFKLSAHSRMAALQEVLGTPVDGIVSSQNESWRKYNPALTSGWKWIIRLIFKRKITFKKLISRWR